MTLAMSYLDIPIIISIIAAAIAIWSACISFKNRAFRIKVYENHTAVLRQVIIEWKDTIPEMMSIDHYDPPTGPFTWT